MNTELWIIIWTTKDLLTKKVSSADPEQATKHYLAALAMPNLMAAHVYFTTGDDVTPIELFSYRPNKEMINS